MVRTLLLWRLHLVDVAERQGSIFDCDCARVEHNHVRHRLFCLYAQVQHLQQTLVINKHSSATIKIQNSLPANPPLKKPRSAHTKLQGRYLVICQRWQRARSPGTACLE